MQESGFLRPSPVCWLHRLLLPRHHRWRPPQQRRRPQCRLGAALLRLLRLTPAGGRHGCAGCPSSRRHNSAAQLLRRRCCCCRRLSWHRFPLWARGGGTAWPPAAAAAAAPGGSRAGAGRAGAAGAAAAAGWPAVCGCAEGCSPGTSRCVGGSWEPLLCTCRCYIGCSTRVPLLYWLVRGHGKGFG